MSSMSIASRHTSTQYTAPPSKVVLAQVWRGRSNRLQSGPAAAISSSCVVLYANYYVFTIRFYMSTTPCHEYSYRLSEKTARNVRYLGCLRFVDHNLVQYVFSCRCGTLSAFSLECASLSFTICLSFPYGAVFKDKTAALSHFELLDYDPTELVSQHERLRRGAAESSTIRFSFSAFNRYVDMQQLV